jgi:hypothetical protein
MQDNVISLWDKASCIDPTLSVRKTDIPTLLEKRIRAAQYSRALLFSRMAQGHVSLFNNFSVPIKGSSTRTRLSCLLRGIDASFSASSLAEIQAGPSSRRYKVSVPELVKRWKRGRAIISVTDLHFRGTRFDEFVNTSRLSDFNILCSDPKFGAELMDQLEMMTLVISSEGNLTDNHTDDCDGSNHCFIGKKLWLAWDRMEGRARGFEDVDRDGVIHTAAFDMAEFISMPSSRWFTVNENETLFLPGSLTHKVITLEHYIGLGSFHVALPSYIRSLRRWILYDTLDIGPKKLIEKINQAVMRRILRLQDTKTRTKEHWGVVEMKKSIKAWNKWETHEMRESLLRHPLFAGFYKTATEA